MRSTFIISSIPERNSLNLVSLPKKKKKTCALEGYESNHSSLIQGEVTSSSQERLVGSFLGHSPWAASWHIGDHIYIGLNEYGSYPKLC